MVSGIFAILGVLLGSFLTYLVQIHVARRGEEFALSERARREQLDAFSAAASAVMEARRCQIDRWYQRREKGRNASEYKSVKAESYRARSEARRQLYRVSLVADDATIARILDDAIDSLHEIPKTESRESMERFADRTRQLVEQFVDVAASKLRKSEPHLME